MAAVNGVTCRRPFLQIAGIAIDIATSSGFDNHNIAY
jgi:hypothetical protein